MPKQTVKSKPPTMGRRLASLRVLRDLSQEEAARRVGIGGAMLSLIENDLRVPSVPTLVALVELYEGSLDYVVHGAPEQTAA